MSAVVAELLSASALTDWALLISASILVHLALSSAPPLLWASAVRPTDPVDGDDGGSSLTSGTGVDCRIFLDFCGDWG